MGMRSSLLFVAGVALAALPVRGAPINYGNFTGTTIIFQNVSEDSTTDPTPLFGAPTLSGDSLAFNPLTFGANSSNGTGADITDGTLQMTLQSKPGLGVHSFTLSEAGDYTLAGTGSSATTAQVSATLFIRVLKINDADPVGGAFGPNLNLVFTPTGTPPTAFGGQYHLPADAGIGIIWQGTKSVDIDALLTAAGYNTATQHATLVSVNMDNTLLAISENGTIAFIKKKATEGLVITVPEPATMGLLFLGASVLLGRRRA